MIRALLTIDDVSSNNTPAIVDYLNEKNITAIMFMVGEWAENHPSELIYALQHGMIVGNHSYSHPNFSRLTPEEGIREIEKCEELLDRLYAAAGVERKFRPFRFPYGDKGGDNKGAFQRFLAEKRRSRRLAALQRRLPAPAHHVRQKDAARRDARVIRLFLL